MFYTGFYGEAVPPDCGCTAVQKTHGFALEGLVPAGLAQRTAEVKLFRGRGILLLRNPYEALLSYRNFLYGGHTGFAPHSQFKGPGNTCRECAMCCLFENESILKHLLLHLIRLVRYLTPSQSPFLKDISQ